jgi:hypothetical protein
MGGKSDNGKCFIIPKIYYANIMFGYFFVSLEFQDIGKTMDRTIYCMVGESTKTAAIFVKAN